MKTTTYTVGETALLVVPARQYASRTVYLDPLAQDVYIGGSNVTTATGLKLTKNTIAPFIIPPNETLYAIVATGTAPLTVLEPTT